MVVCVGGEREREKESFFLNFIFIIYYFMDIEF